jgi:hypothetical protein
VEIFESKWFERFARKERIADGALREAVDRAAGTGEIERLSDGNSFPARGTGGLHLWVP